MLENKGLSITQKQGDFTTSSYMPEALEAEFDSIKAALEAGGEVTVTGYSVCKRESVAPARVEGTAGVTLAVKNATLRSATGVVVMNIKGKLPEGDVTKLTAMGTVAKGKTVSGIAIDDFQVKTGATSY